MVGFGVAGPGRGDDGAGGHGGTNFSGDTERAFFSGGGEVFKGGVGFLPAGLVGLRGEGMRGETESGGEGEVGRLFAAPEIFAVVEIAAAHEGDAGGFVRTAVIVWKAKAVAEFMGDAAEIPGVELGDGHLHLVVVMFFKDEGLVFLGEQFGVEEVAIGGVAEAVAVIAPAGAVVGGGEDEAAAGLALAQAVEDEDVFALGIEFIAQGFADFVPGFIAGFVLVMSGGVAAFHGMDDEFTFLIAFQREAGSFQGEALLHLLAVEGADIGHDAVEASGVIGQGLAIGGVEIDDADEGVIGLFSGVEGGDALLRGVEDGVGTGGDEGAREQQKQGEEK